jgi:hypothetical protein
MEISEIIKDSFAYPLNDKRQFGLIFLVFLLLGIIVCGSIVSFSYLARINQTGFAIILFVLALIVSLITLFFLGGYQLSIIAVACERDDEIPSFNPVKNIKDGLKVLLIYIVFSIINALVSFVFVFSSFAILTTGEMAAVVISIILYVALLIVTILISWTFAMALCRMAYYDSMDEALKLRKAFSDLRTVGILKMLVYVIVMGIIILLIAGVLIAVAVALIQSLSNFIVPVIVIMLVLAVSSYIFVVQSRALGLLYSNIEYDF